MKWTGWRGAWARTCSSNSGRSSTGHSMPGRVPGPRIPIPVRRPPSAVLAVPSSLCPLSLVPSPMSLARRPPVPPCLRAALIVSHSAFYTLHSSPVTGVPRFPVPRPARLWRVPGSRFPPSLPSTGVPRFPAALSLALIVYLSSAPKVIHNGVCASVHVKSHQIPIKIDQTATFSVKKGSKRRAFRHAHLNIWGGVTPSGASARAVLAYRKGKKGAFSDAPRRVPKLSTICTAVLDRAARPGRGLHARAACGRHPPKPARKAPRLTCRRGGRPCPTPRQNRSGTPRRL